MLNLNNFANEFVRRFGSGTPSWRRLNTYIGEWNEAMTDLREAFDEWAFNVYFDLFDMPELDVFKDSLTGSQFDRFDAAVRQAVRRRCASHWCNEFNEGREFWRWLMHG